MVLPGPVVTGRWLAETLKASPDSIRVVDVRWAMGDGPKRQDHLDGHIPGAVFVDLDTDLSDPPGERGRHPLPTAERFAESRARLGIDARPVVAYDDQSGAQAARLWWMLDAIGHPVAVLDGGIQAWPGPMETGPVDVPRAEVTVVPWPEERFVDVSDVLPAIAGGAVLVDARSADRFAGRPNPIDVRPGHIPGSVSRPWTENVGPDGRFLAPERLRAELDALGVGSGSTLIASCGSGVTGCHDLLAARLAGFEGGSLYTGSWSEWSLDRERPVSGGSDRE